MRARLAALVLAALLAACGDDTTARPVDGGPWPPDLPPGARLALREGWQVQSSTGQPGGEAISKPGFAAAGWYPTTAPATVAGVLAQNGVYPDPFGGMNLRDWPGIGYPVGEQFVIYEMPDDSPFRVGWWFRTEFDLPAELAGRALELHLEGVNYRADVWLNGQRLADATEVVGAARRFVLDVTRAARPGARNALAFFVRLRVIQGPGGGEVLPTLWDDNYVSLEPGETRTLTARWRPADAHGATPVVAVDGWNVGP